VNLAARGVFTEFGQRYKSSTRVFIDAGVYDEFVQMIARLAGRCREECEKRQQIDGTQLEKILEYIELGKKEGAQLVCGGKQHGKQGFYVEPTVFANVRDEMKIAQEEVGGGGGRNIVGL